MRRSSTLMSFMLAGSLFVSSLPTLAHAGPLTAIDGPAQGAEDPALTEAKTLYKEGEIKFQTADYEDALALWKRAFAILPDGEETRAIRHALVYNIAEAHRRAYEVSRNPTHLRKAKILLENYRADHRALYGDEKGAVKERAEVDDRIVELDKMIADSEAAGEVSTPLSEPGTTGDVQNPPPDGGEPVPPPQPTKPLTPKQQWEADIKADPTYGPMWEKSQKRIVGGAVLTGIGIPFVIGSVLLVIYGVQLRDPNQLLDGSGLAFTGGAVMGVIGLGLTIPGGVLLGTGIGMRKKVLRDNPQPTGALRPMFLPDGGGLAYTLRF